MAAYAALVSLMHIVDNIQLHPRPPISLSKEQVFLLTEKVNFLQEFLEGYNPHRDYTAEADPLEIRIADAAYAAEGVIESHIVDQITGDGEKVNSDALYVELEKVIEEMKLIQKEAIEIKQTQHQHQHQLQRNSTPPDSMRFSFLEKKSIMVGADDVLLQMKDKLTSDRRDLQIIPLVGMGGTGKTTLAINIYQDRLIKEHFHICGWATISQEYSIPEILMQVLCQLNQNVDQSLSLDELGDILYKYLFGRKYLIIMDDMWSIEAWDGIKWFLPNNHNGSRVVVTTRLSDLASGLPNSDSLKISLLDHARSWDLLSKTVFGEKVCPQELEEIGKRIGKKCKGLPLSIVVVGGLLAKSPHTREFWEYIEENLNSVVNLEDDERCLKILHMSYKQLPTYLKPCFLFMGVFPEDHVIRVSMLVQLWVVEGFLKPVNGKSLEELAKDYLMDLVSRNLILVPWLDNIGSIKRCQIHDLLRDLCLREAKKERFYTVTAEGTGNAQRRIVISKNEHINALSSMSPVRSLFYIQKREEIPPVVFSLRLLRILVSFAPQGNKGFLKNVQQFVNSRFLSYKVFPKKFKFDSSMCSLFWNLQTLIVPYKANLTEPTHIWYMHHIRHLKFRLLDLPDPPIGHDDIVLGNLQTLETIRNFKFRKQVVKRIPNIKKLAMAYDKRIDDDRYSLNNLDCLHKLESLRWFFGKKSNLSRVAINFPHSLKKLILNIIRSQYWQDILDKIVVLPLLQRLTLCGGRFKDGKWETTRAQFPNLKCLEMYECRGLRVWTTESSHFPCLQFLFLSNIYWLKEIPLDFAELSTLGKIHMFNCGNSAAISAKRILEEQEELYGEEEALKVTVITTNKKLESLKSPNFDVISI